MKKTLSIVLALMLLCSLFTGFTALAEGTTQVGTPRSETLVMECQSPTDNPGQFNPYMIGTSMGFGVMKKKL